jgi:hypothetical protein
MFPYLTASAGRPVVEEAVQRSPWANGGALRRGSAFAIADGVDETEESGR